MAQACDMADNLSTKPALTPDELIAKGICPVKPEFVRKVTRIVQEAVTGTGSGVANEEAKAKSKSKQRQDRKSQNPSQLCNSFTFGKCLHGDRCRYSHDVEAYLKTKAADLPGRCPFSSTGSCHYGITCRWAGSHTYSDAMQELLVKLQLQTKAQEGQLAQSIAETRSKPDTEGQQNGHSLDTSAVAKDASPEQQQQQQLGAALQVVELPVAAHIEKAINVMEKDVQNKLWKNRYDFGRADDVLRSLGLRISLRGGGEDKGGKGNKNQSQKGQQQQQQQEDGLEKQQQQQDKGEGDAAAPGLKRQKLDVGAAEGAEVSEAAGSAAAAAAAAADSGGGSTAAAQDTAGPPPAAAGVADPPAASTSGVATTEDWAHMHVETALRPEEKKIFDVRGKTYLAPLTTVGNLPFRRVCKSLGVDITCGEMALATNLLQGQASEWALLKRHPCEDFFGVQVCGGFPDALARTAQLIDENITVDFVDVNMGCPIDLVCDRAAGSSLLLRPKRIEEIAKAMSRAMAYPLTLKTRKGYYDDKDVAHTFLPQVRSWGAVALTLHGRTRQQRYSRQADWQYIERCSELAPDLQFIGNGDIFSFEDWNEHLTKDGVATCMIGRGALIKPWIFTEIKEQRHWDISAGERLDLLKSFCSCGLEHWGSDSRGVETTRKFLLEWLSYLCRYVPVGLLEVVPQKLHWRPPAFVGRNDLETLLSSDSAADWVRISEMLLGPVPPGFTFTPKHKSSSYTASSESELAAFADEQAEG